MPHFGMQDLPLRAPLGHPRLCVPFLLSLLSSALPIPWERRSSDLPGVLAPDGHQDGCSCHAALGRFILVCACGFACSRPCNHSSALQKRVQAAAVGAGEWCMVPPAAKLSHRQGQPRGPCKQGPLEQSWTGTDAAAACTRVNQRARVSWGLAGK